MVVSHRQMRRSDAAEIRGVALLSWRHAYRGIFTEEFIEKFVGENYSDERLAGLLPEMRAGNAFFFVAFEDGKILGFCNIGRSSGWELFHIYVLPEYARKGIGRRLLRRGEDFLRRKGAKKYFCFVYKRNAVAAEFYARSGFSRVPEEDKADELYLEKRL